MGDRRIGSDAGGEPPVGAEQAGDQPVSPPGRTPRKVEGLRLVNGGECLARHPDGSSILVRGLLPGESALVHVHGQRHGAWRGSVHTLLDRSTRRVDPPCPHIAAGCGGCTWQHLDNSDQLAEKVEIAIDAYVRAGTVRVRAASGGPPVRADRDELRARVVRAGGSVPSTGYRTTVRAGVLPDGRLGLRAERSHLAVAMDPCLVAHPGLAAVLAEGRFPGHEEVTVRTSAWSGETFALIGQHAPKRISVPAGVQVVRDVHQSASFVERVHDMPLRVSTGSFFQSGPAAAELLVDTVTDLLHDVEVLTLVDLYAGVGLFAATVGRFADRLVVVESAASSVADARVNLDHRDADAVQFDERVVALWRPRPRPRQPVVVVADPPRSGLGPDAVSRVLEVAPATVVLVSCDAAAAARDAALFSARGWQLEEAVVLDLFPHSHHLEVVARFTAAE